MEEIMSDIRRGCNLSRKLEENLQELSRHPDFLRSTCQEVVDVFMKAIDRLLTADSHLNINTSSGSVSSMAPHGNSQINMIAAIDFVQTANLAAEGINNIDPYSMPVMASSVGGETFEFPSGCMYIGSRGSNGDQAYVGSALTSQTVITEGAVRRAEAGPPKRSSRKRFGVDRKEGAGCHTVRVLASGNADNPPDDGHTWRKYGQKVILGCKYPRSYFRCTHKNYSGCVAKKDVQRLDENPLIYEVTYFGTHGCQTSPTPLQLIPSILTPNTGAASQGEAAAVTLNPSSTQQLSSILGGIFYRDSIDNVHQAGSFQAHQRGQDADCPVTDLADAMFNSGSSGSSIDAIFPTGQERWESGDNKKQE